MATRVYVNNISTRLTAAVAAGDLTIAVTAGTGVSFAAATGGDWIVATLCKVSGYRETAWEIVKVTARSTDTLTITRAQESTSALTFAVGDVVDVRTTAQSFTELAGNVTIPGTLGVTGQQSNNGTGAVRLKLYDTTSTTGANLLSLYTVNETVVGLIGVTATQNKYYLGSNDASIPGANIALAWTSAGAVTIPGTLALTATASPTGTGAGAVGQIAWDTAYLYVCTAVNDWRRIALVDF